MPCSIPLKLHHEVQQTVDLHQGHKKVQIIVLSKMESQRTQFSKAVSDQARASATLIERSLWDFFADQKKSHKHGGKGIPYKASTHATRITGKCAGVKQEYQ